MLSSQGEEIYLQSYNIRRKEGDECEKLFSLLPCWMVYFPPVGKPAQAKPGHRSMFLAFSECACLRMGSYAILDKKCVLSDLFSPLYIIFLSILAIPPCMFTTLKTIVKMEEKRCWSSFCGKNVFGLLCCIPHCITNGTLFTTNKMFLVFSFQNAEVLVKMHKAISHPRKWYDNAKSSNPLVIATLHLLMHKTFNFGFVTTIWLTIR